MFLKLIAWTTLISFILAKLEIQIEGKDGWAKNLPTWRKKNWITKILYSETPITGYHFWLLLMIFLFFHLPFFAGIPWSLKSELEVLASLIFFWIIEDFLWFVLNPHYGIKKFNPQNIPWHSSWWGPLPDHYIKGTISIIILFVLSQYL